ncbi:MAG: SDR family oxidoreductase [Candidatus Binatia bacterium]
MILVTGATGNVGRELVSQLLPTGEVVRALSRDPDRARLPAGVEVRVADLGKPETIPAVLEGVDRVFLLVHIPGDPVQAANFIRAATASDVRHVVLLSSLSVESDAAKDPIAEFHRAAERAVRESGLSWTFLRPGTFMSNTLVWAESIRSEGAVRNLGGNFAAAPIDELDVAAVARLALTSPGHEGKSYPMTGPERITPAEQTQVLAEVLGRELRFETLPEDVARAMIIGMIGDEAAATRILRSLRDPDVPWAHPRRTVEELTGTKPRGFREWAARHVGRFR